MERQPGRGAPCAHSPFRSKAATSTEGDDENQNRDRADGDPQPFLVRQSGSLNLVQVLRELMKIPLGELGQTLIDFLLRESMGSESSGHLIVGHNIPDQGEIGVTRFETLVRRGLRRNRRGKGWDGYECKHQ